MNIFEGLKAVSNVHLLFVHFPVALLIIGCVLFFAGNLFYKHELLIAAKCNIILGAISSVATVATGFIAFYTISHNEEIHHAMTIHRNLMVITTILSVCLCVFLLLKKDILKIQRNILFCAGIVVMVALLAIGADYGGKMVFKYGAGTELFRKVNPELEDGHKHDHNAHDDQQGRSEGGAHKH